MIKTIELKLTPEQAFGEKNFRYQVAKALRISKEDITHLNIIKRSIDSRGKSVIVILRVEVVINEPHYQPSLIRRDYPNANNSPRVIIVGFGPAGMFAALRLIELGIKPVILERGKDVHARKQDIASLNRKHQVNPDSNYCFGEGGAGTFSDGKLYTRATKRGNTGRIIETFVFHGANHDILVDAHPHIGSDKLPAIVESMRNTIIRAGGEVHFGKRVEGLIINGRQVEGVIDQDKNHHHGRAVILATGHSARDVYEMLDAQKVTMEFKPFALGIRVEHPQSLINSIQYHSKHKNPFLPAAAYNLVHQVDNRGVFSFCMCPGGVIVPSATGNEQLVVNGMSNAQRNSPYANSGIVVSVDESDLLHYETHGIFKGLKFQEKLEQITYLAGGSCQRAPAQRLTDFVSGKQSSSLPPSSYIPGLTPYPVHQIFPEPIVRRLQEGIKAFDRNMKGFLTEDAIAVAVESRTSSAIRIPRDPVTCEHTGIANLYPCGEGSGYSGGIVSSAIDGENVAEKIAEKIFC